MGDEPSQPRGYDIGVLSWSPELEHWATNWAATCPTDHRGNLFKKPNPNAPYMLDGTYFGENIYWAWTGRNIDLKTFNVTDAVKLWYDEAPLFNSSTINPFVFSYPAGHYT